MAIPTLITVAGQFLRVDGTPDSGTITFQSRVFTLYSHDSVAVVPSKLSVPLDETGSFQIEVPATDDPAWAPADWTYTLTIKLIDSYSVYQVSVPYDATELSLAELIPVGSFSTPAPANYAPLVHNHTAADIVSGTIASARLPIGVSAGTVAAGDHTHSGGSNGPIAIGDVTGLTTALNGKVNSADLSEVAFTGDYADLSNRPTIPVTSVAGKTGAVTLAKSDVGLSNVDNTTDSAKPVSTAQQTALNLKANIASPTFTGTVSGITKSHVGLGNVDNTSDANKPISTATQTALNDKASVSSVSGVSDRVSALEDMTPNIMMWNGTAYEESDSARIYIGPNDPGVVPDGSVWIDTDA